MNYRTIGFGLAAFAAGVAVWMAGSAKIGAKRLAAPATPDSGEGHVPTDLLGDSPPRPGDRAPVVFRPDPTAVPTPDEREALRPATGPAPSLAADRGSGFGGSTDAA